MENTEVEEIEDEEDVIDRDNFDSFSEWRLAVIKRGGLQVGENYADNFGNYRIISSIDGKACVLRLTDQREEILDAEFLLAKTIERYLNIIVQDKNKETNQRKNSKNSKKDGRKGNFFSRKPFLFTPSNNFYKTLGYLAKYSKLYIRVLVKDKELFHDEFFELKGYDLVPEPGVFCILKSNEGTSQFASELSVVVRNPGWELDTGSIKQEGGKKSTESKVIYNSADMVWWLLEQGFNVGRPHDIEQIRSGVPDWFKESFDSGVMHKIEE